MNPKTISPETPIQAEEFVTKDELARRLKVAVRTIEAWQSAGLIPFSRIGRTVRFDYREVVEELKTKFKVKAREERAAPATAAMPIGE